MKIEKTKIEKTNSIGSNRQEAIILHTDILKFDEDKNRLLAAIQITALLNVLAMVQKMYKKLNVKFTLQTGILHTAMDAILTGRALTMEEQEEYCIFKQQFEKVIELMENFTELSEYRPDPEIDLALFGYFIDAQTLNENLSRENYLRNLCEVENLSLDLEQKQIEIEEYIEKMNTLVDQYSRKETTDAA